MNDKTSTPEQKETAINDTTPKVTGIGGIFFQSANPKKIAEWYGKNLGLAIDDYGSPFEFRNANRPEEINYLRWSPLIAFLPKSAGQQPNNNSEVLTLYSFFQ